MATLHRDYAPLTRLRPGASREATMRLATDALWDALSPHSVSWLGFYTKPRGRDELILGACRDKPACSPLGLHGICGQSFTAGRPIVVRDVATLGGNYIACDPRDKSEVVVPLMEPANSGPVCWGVLDLDSHEVGAFDDRDAAELTRLMERLGLSAPHRAELLRL